MISDERKSYALFFLFGMFLLAVLNLLTYPYMPFNGVLLTGFFLFLSVAAVTMSYYDVSYSSFYGVVFSSFNFMVLLSRVFVNTSGIGTPKSSGSLGPVKIEQLWIGGIHLHHYWLGLLLLATSFYMLKKQFSDFRTAAVLGTSIALVVDELGILLAGHTYHSWISYAGLVTINAFLFLLLFRPSISNIYQDKVASQG